MTKDEQIKILDVICPLRCGKTSIKRTRHEFFTNIKTESQAYILGFHTADGHVDYTKQMLRFQLQEPDKEIIYLLKDVVAPDARIWTAEGRDIKRNGIVLGHTSNIIGIDIYSKQIRDDLISLNVGPRKTYNEIHLPNFNDSLLFHFIRGYFDGDGCFSWGVCKKHGEYKSWLWHKAGIVAKTKTLLEEIQEFLYKYNINGVLTYRKDRDLYNLEINQSESLKKLFHLLYDDSNFYLKRKYDKFNHFVNTEVTQLIAEYRNAQKVSASDSNNPSTSAEHPTRVKMCAELTGNCESSEIKSSEDNKLGMKWDDCSTSS